MDYNNWETFFFGQIKKLLPELALKSPEES